MQKTTKPAHAIRPVILSGSAAAEGEIVPYPKPFATLVGEESLFVTTLRRICGGGYEPPIIVAAAEHQSFIEDALAATGLTPEALILEPFGRHTATAALMAVFAETQGDRLHLVLPCDHLIGDEATFHRSIAAGSPLAQAGDLVLFGIAPNRPETEFGYILPDGARPCAEGHKIAHFQEKPSEIQANRLIKDGALWNSGIFLYQPQTLEREAAAIAPVHYESCQRAFAAATRQNNRIMPEEAMYASLPACSLDMLICERTRRGAVIRCDMNWDDVGSWRALWPLAPKPQEAEEAGVIRLPSPLVPRQWGTYENLTAGSNFLVKHIIVRPGCSLSRQKHFHRDEHWVVVAGTATVELEDSETILLPNQSFFIPKGAVHRLSNLTASDLHVIEVQSGDLLSEDDIIRFDETQAEPA